MEVFSVSFFLKSFFPMAFEILNISSGIDNIKSRWSILCFTAEKTTNGN